MTDYLPRTCITGYFEKCCQFWALCWQLILYEFAIFNSVICCYLLFLTNWKSLLHGGDFDSSKFQEKRVAAYNFQLLDLNSAVRLHSITPLATRREAHEFVSYRNMYVSFRS